MNFRDLKRKDRQTDDKMISDILEKGEYGVLSLIGDNGYPYAVPVSYAYYNKAIHFHCAKSGHKIDAIRACNKVSFCVVTDTEVLPEDFSTKYKSVIAFGKAEEISGEEKKIALMKLIEKYSVGFIEKGRDYVEKEQNDTVVVKILIEHITGKARG